MEVKIQTDDAVFFHDTLTVNKPYIARKPRNHDSLAFVTSGTLSYEKQGKITKIRQGEVAYIAKGSVDRSQAADGDAVSYLAVNFNFDPAFPGGKLPFQTVCSVRHPYRYEKLFRNALAEYNLRLPGSRMICSGILCQIIGLLCNDLSFDKVNDKTAKKMELALDYFNRNFSRSDLKISESASAAGMSEKHFRRLFSKLYQKNPHEFLRELRLNHAELLLLHTEKAISDIADLCGFSDVYSFSHCFKQHFGASPRQYRETQEGKEKTENAKT